MSNGSIELRQDLREYTAGQSEKEGIAKEAERVFRDSPYYQLRGLRCEYCEGILTILGHLPSFYLKQLAQCAVQHLSDVDRIQNHVVVD